MLALDAIGFGIAGLVCGWLLTGSFTCLSLFSLFCSRWWPRGRVPGLAHFRQLGTYSATSFNDEGMVLTDIAAYDSNVQVIGTLDFYFSNDAGNTYKNSSFPYPGAAQNVDTIGNELGSNKLLGFGMIGGWIKTIFDRLMGIAVSYDGGKDYAVTNLTLLQTYPRFGAYPSANTWFVTAGQFPGEGSDDNGHSSTPTSQAPTTADSAGEFIVNPEHYYNSDEVGQGSIFIKEHGGRAHVLRSPEGKLFVAIVRKEFLLEANVPRFGLTSGPNITTYWSQVSFYVQLLLLLLVLFLLLSVGVSPFSFPFVSPSQVVKTANAGQNWTLLHNVFNKDYSNDMHCTSETHCCMAVEAPPHIGGSLVCTFDGETFTTQYQNPDPYSSIMAISALSEDVWWAAGGELMDLGVLNSQFYQSVDGGRTWAKAGPQWPGQYVFTIDCIPSANNCWATMMEQSKGTWSVATISA